MRWQNLLPTARPVVDYGDPVMAGQRNWWTFGEVYGSKVSDLLNPLSQGAMQSGATRVYSYPTGHCLDFDAGANAYVDLGANFVQGGEPFTLHWLEWVASGVTNYPAIACFFPVGGSQRWLCFRSRDASYDRLAMSLGSSTMLTFDTAPTVDASVEIWQQWILVGRAGINSVTAADWTLYVDGIAHSASGGGSLGSQTSQLNYLGWDGADLKWKGRLANFRRWGRALGTRDIDRLVADPWAGLLADDLILVPGAPPPPPPGLHRMFIAM